MSNNYPNSHFILRCFIISSFLWLTYCYEGPDGFFDCKWGDSVSNVIAKAGLRCSGWSALYADKRFSSCTCDTTTVFGYPVHVMIVKEGDRFGGVVFRFNDCMPSISSEIKKTITKYYRLEKPEKNESDDIYIIWGDSFVNESKNMKLLHYDEQNCELTIAGNNFADFYSTNLLREGLQDLGNGLRSH